MTLDEHRAAIGDKFRAALNDYLRKHKLIGTATYDIRLQEAPRSVTLQVNRKSLLAALQAARVAVSTDDTRHYLNGVLLEYTGAAVHVVGCDGHRLVATQLDVHAADRRPASSILDDRRPRAKSATAAAIKTLKASRETTVALTLGGTHVTIDGNCYGTIAGTYPDWKRVLPRCDGNVITVTISAPALRDTLARALKSDKCFNPVRIDKSAATFGDEAIPVTTPNGGWDGAFGINAKYLLDVAKSASDVLTIGHDPAYQTGPLQVDCGDGVCRVVMPLRV